MLALRSEDCGLDGAMATGAQELVCHFDRGTARRILRFAMRFGFRRCSVED